MVKSKKPPLTRPPARDIDLDKLDKFAAAADTPIKAIQQEPENKSTQEPKPEADSQIEAEPKVGPKSKPIKNDSKSPKKFPWEQEGINPKVIIPFNLRVNQPNNLKLKYLVKHSPNYKSIHDFCMQAVLEKLERELPKLGK